MLFHHMIEGNDAVLTVNIGLQQLAADQLKGKRGAVVVLDPATGAIRAMVSAPQFDPQQPGEYIKAAHAPMFNRATHGLYPPGSTFKVLVAAAAIARGQVVELDCPAEGFSAEPGARPIRDHEYYAAQGNTWFNRWHGHGRIDLATALRKSSNVYFAQLGVKLGGAVLADQLTRWEFGKSHAYYVGTDGSLVSKSCSVPALATRREVAQMSIGQGRLLVTPLQMAMVAATVANGGIMMAPLLDATKPPQSLGRKMKAADAARLGHMLERAVSRGTGRGALASGVSVCGKTGTAQNSAGADHGWVICYAPAHAPRIALAVLVENGGYGSTAAVPIAAALIRRARELGLLKEGR
jgi:peptidoglycan glycosyltransferase